MLVWRGLKILIALAFATPALAATPCTHSIGSCDYYLCRENVQQCGPEGYLQGFGYHYCEAFHEVVQPRVSPNGAAWLDRVAVCLQQRLDALPVSASCENTHEFAIHTHADCYVQTGWCQLSNDDRLKVMQQVFPAAADPRVDWEFLKILASCGAQPSDSN